jgi:hypothetical protein
MANGGYRPESHWFDVGDPTLNWTVAHEVALHGHLPAGFGQCDIVDRASTTVGRLALANRQGDPMAAFSRWIRDDDNNLKVS